MNSDRQFLSAFYAMLLKLYPKIFREGYGEELQSVFDLSVEEAAIKGGFEVGKLILRELVSLPMAVFLEHLRERRNAKMDKRFGSYFDFAYGSWKEFLTALLPFFLTGGIMPLLHYLGRARIASGMVGTGIVLALFGLFLVLFLVGVKMRMPRWSLPYLGFLFAILSVYLFSAIFGTPLYFIFRNVRDQSLFFIDLLWDGIFWYGLLTAILVLVILARTSSAFQHFRNDWTQLNFILYGAIPFAIWLTFDEYVGEEPYVLAVFLALALGAWIYLRSNNEWMRFAVLFVGLTAAMFIATVGKLILIPAQSWSSPIETGLATSDAKHTFFMWGWFALGMLIPLGIKFMPQPKPSAQISPLEG